MNRLIIKLHEVCVILRGFVSSYTTTLKNEMVIKYAGKVYHLRIEEIKDINQCHPTVVELVNNVNGYKED